MMYAKSESDDITSLTTSSSPRLLSPPPPKQPPRQVYYVQSPSRESHEEDKSSTSASLSATQATTTPIGLHSPGSSLSLLSIFSRQSRWSAASRVSGGGGGHGYRRKRRERERVRLLEGGRRSLPGVEEGVEEGYGKWWSEEDGEDFGWSCRVAMGMVMFVLVFVVGCGVIWGASRHFGTQVFVKNVMVHNLYLGEGSDLTGVPTRILTINCSLVMRVHNPATFFGIHVSHSTINLRYYDLIIATGQLNPYYQPRKSWQKVVINIGGKKVPLYGAGDGFVVSDNAQRVPLILDFEVRSQGSVVGKLVKSKHRRHVRCSLNISCSTPQMVKLGKNSCVYLRN